MKQAPHSRSLGVQISYSLRSPLNGANSLVELVKAIGEPKQTGMNMLKIADFAQNFRTSGNILPLSAISFPISLP